MPHHCRPSHTLHTPSLTPPCQEPASTSTPRCAAGDSLCCRSARESPEEWECLSPSASYAPRLSARNRHVHCFDVSKRTNTSVAVLAEISLRSPRKWFIFTIKKIKYRMKVSQNLIIQFWKKLHWRMPSLHDLETMRFLTCGMFSTLWTQCGNSTMCRRWSREMRWPIAYKLAAQWVSQTSSDTDKQATNRS